MKILHVNVNNSGGGVEQYLMQLFTELDIRGYKNLFLYGEKNNGKIIPPGVESFFIEKITHLHCKDLQAKLNLVQDIISSYGPDIVYIHQVLNLELIDFLTKRLPSIRFVHGFKLICPDGVKTLKSTDNLCHYPLGYSCQLRSYLYKCMPRNPFIGLPLLYSSKKISKIHKTRSFIIVASKFMKSVLIKNGFIEKNIKVIPYFTYLPKLKEKSLPNDSKKILAVGRLVKAKGMHHLINAFSMIDEKIQLDIVGDGPEAAALKRLVQQRGLTSKINFYGWLTHEKVKKIYANSFAVAVPSVWPEPFGIVGIEALAHGKPVVAFNSGGISEWLLNGNTGFLVKVGDDEGLADKIEMLLKDAELRKFMGKNGRELVKKHFIPEVHLKSLVTLIENSIRH
jgi:glycosyltransferase involved in cell wall biosynthesis